MDSLGYQLLVIDLCSNSLLAINGPSGEIIKDYPYDPGLKPLNISIAADGKAYIPAASGQDTGAFLILDLKAQSLARLPVTLPKPVQFTFQPGTGNAFLADDAGRLYVMNTAGMTVTELGRSGKKAACVGLAADKRQLFTVWDHGDSGTLATFSFDGRLTEEFMLSGIPTGLTLSLDGKAIIPYTANAFTGEGVAIFNPDNKDSGINPAVITIQCCREWKGLRSYPCHVVIAADNRTAYVVNEDAAGITIIDIHSALITGYIPVGRSISRLYLLPDERFAIASSHMFADLSLIDLVNKRLLSFTANQRQLLGFIAVLPSNTSA